MNPRSGAVAAATAAIVLSLISVATVRGQAPLAPRAGLLTPLMRYTDSPVGRIVTHYDYEDYRSVAGVRTPFKWTRTWRDGRSVFQLTEVQPNVSVPPDRFTRPPQRP